MLADLDTFFVEVERLHMPHLAGRPVVIGGRPGGRGVVAACSYEAREYGIRSAMPMSEAYRRVWDQGGVAIDGAYGNEGTGNRGQGTGRPVGRTAVPANNQPRPGTAAPPKSNVLPAIGPALPSNTTPRVAAASAAGMPSEAKAAPTRPVRLDRQVFFLHDNLFGNYDRYSHRVQDILRSEVPVFRARSIDEFEMDVSGCTRLFTRNHGGVVQFAEYIRRRVRNEVGLKLSIGISPSRIVAKMASRNAKPDGVFMVRQDEIEAFLGPHDVQAVPGIGPATSRILRERGVNRVEQLLALPQRMLASTFGIVMPKLLDALRGEESSSHNTYFGYEEQDGGVQLKRKPKSIGHETTFERDEINPAVWERTLWRLTEDACRRLRKADLRAAHVTVKIRYSDFHSLTHGGFLTEPSDVDSAIFNRVKELFAEGNTRRLRIRLLGVRLSHLCAGDSQGLLFATRRDLREHRFFAAADTIRDKHGKEVLYIGPGVMKLVSPRRVEALSTAGIPSGFMHGRD